MQRCAFDVQRSRAARLSARYPPSSSG